MGFVLCLGFLFISLFAWRFVVVWGLFFFKNLYGTIIDSDTRDEDTISIQQIHMGQLE